MSNHHTTLRPPPDEAGTSDGPSAGYVQPELVETAAAAPGIRVALARAVMEESDWRVLLITTDNEDDRWIAVRDGVASGRAFVTAFRSDVIGFDGDDEDSDAKAITLVGEMEASGLTPVAWLSGRPGHAQVVTVCTTEMARRWWVARAKELGFQPKRRSRPPLAPHRLGLHVALLHPQSPEEALSRLCKRTVTGGPQRLTARTMDRLKNGDPTAPTGSEVVFRIAMGAATKGWSLEMVEAALADESNAGGKAYRKHLAKSPQDAHDWFHRKVWPRAVEYTGTNQPIADVVDARREIAKMRAEAVTFEWKAVLVERQDELGQTVVDLVSARSLRRGLEAILEMGEKAGSIEMSLSQNLLVKASGMSAPTVRKIRKVLERQGWITEIHPHTYSYAGIYRINLTGTRIEVPPMITPRLTLIHGTESSPEQVKDFLPSHSPKGGVGKVGNS